MAKSDARNLRFASVAGAAAGDITIAGMTAADTILSVRVIDFTLTEGTPNTKAWSVGDLTSEFKPLAGKMNNAGGTSSANKLLQVVYLAGNIRGQY